MTHASSSTPSPSEKVLRKEFVYPDAPEVVWLALTDPRALAEWLMPNNFEPRLGHRFIFKTDGAMGLSGVTRCEVLEIDPPRRMAWSWELTPKSGPARWPAMIVSWDLEPIPGGGTRLRFEQRGLQKHPWWVRLSMAMGWSTMHKRWIRQVMARITRRADGLEFVPGAIVREKLCYGLKSITPGDGLVIAPCRADVSPLVTH